MFTTDFCGNFSTQFILNGLVPVCKFTLIIEIPFYSVFTLVNLLFAIFYFSKPAYSSAFSNLFHIRILLNLISFSIQFLILFFSIFVRYFSNHIIIPKFVQYHFGCTVVSYFFSMYTDYFHSHSCVHSSRGHFITIICRVTDVFLLFYFLERFSNESFKYVEWASKLNYINITLIVLSILKLTTHIPIKYAVISNRERLATEIRSSEIHTPQFFHYRKYCSIIFQWVGQIIDHGFYGELYSAQSLPELPSSINLQSLEKLFKVKKSNTSRGWAVLSKLFWSHFKFHFILISSLKFSSCILFLVYPYLFNKFITEMMKNELINSLIFGFLLLFSSVLSTIFDVHYCYQAFLLKSKLNIALSSLIYRSVLKLSKAAHSQIGTGKLINYLTTDVDRISQCLNTLTELLAVPVQAFVACVLLCLFIGKASLVGIAFLIVLLIFNRYIANKISFYAQKMLLAKDQRIVLFEQMLSNMHSIKSSTLESVIYHKVCMTRKSELKALKYQKLLDAICVFLWAAIPAILTCSTFATYAIIGNKLDPATIFTGVGLLGMLIGPMNAFPWILNSFIEAFISTNRVFNLFSRIHSDFEESQIDTEDLDVSLLRHEQFNNDNSSCEVIINVNSFYYWSKPLNKDDEPSIHLNITLKNIDLKIKKGEFILINGPTGCGKSSLLLALMGELYGDNFSAQHISQALTFGYAGQDSWIQKSSVLNNIMLNSNHDENWLNHVINACCLREDLDNLPTGILSDCGEAGNKLSGGQKARINLARAIYQKNCQLLVLDDPLASLDTTIANQILNNLLHKDHGLLVGKTVILATNRELPRILSDKLLIPHQTVLMEEGSIVNIIKNMDNYNQQTYQSISDEDVECNSGQLNNDVQIISHGFFNQGITSRFEEGQNIINEDEFEGKQRLSTGTIESKVLWSYLKWIGIPLSTIVLFSLFFMQVGNNIGDFWLSIWTNSVKNANKQLSVQSSSMMISNPIIFILQFSRELYSSQKDSIRFYLSIYLGIIGAVIFFTSIRAISFAYAGLHAASKAHKNIFETILLTQMPFFESVSVGQILNRFSSDINTVDDGLPFLLNILLANIGRLLGTLILMCILVPIVIFLIIPMTFIFWSIQHRYRRTARSLRRISSVTNSPVYTWLVDTIHGMVHIRGLKREDVFLNEFMKRLAVRIKSDLAMSLIGAWLFIRLQFLNFLVLALIIPLAILGLHFNWWSTQISMTVLAISYAMGVVGQMSSCLTAATDTETQFIALERVIDLDENTPIETQKVETRVMAPLSPTRRLAQRILLKKELQDHIKVGTKNYFEEIDINSVDFGRIEFTDVCLEYPTYKFRDCPSNPANYERATSNDETSHLSNKDDQLALRHITFNLKPGKKLGIIGRTGSGKSSILKCLLRLVPHLDGPDPDLRKARVRNFRGVSGVIKIDGQDIRLIPLYNLRSRISTVSQDCFLFTGSLRQNLDPSNLFTDEQILEVIVTCCLMKIFSCNIKESFEDKYKVLNFEIAENGSNLSVGERQLIAFARTYLRIKFHQLNAFSNGRGIIICLDEATAHIDYENERIVENVILNHFPCATIIVVAHRLSNVLHICDEIILMKQGQIVETGSPKVLLEQSDSLFSQIYKNSNSNCIDK